MDRVHHGCSKESARAVCMFGRVAHDVQCSLNETRRKLSCPIQYLIQLEAVTGFPSAFLLGGALERGLRGPPVLQGTLPTPKLGTRNSMSEQFPNPWWPFECVALPGFIWFMTMLTGQQIKHACLQPPKAAAVSGNVKKGGPLLGHTVNCTGVHGSLLHPLAVHDSPGMHVARLSFSQMSFVFLRAKPPHA